MGKVFFRVLLMLVFIFASTPAMAQMNELTSADRLALLYSSQLVFNLDGVPSVRVGLARGLDEVTFTAKGPIKVMPLGPQGPELTLPAGTKYTIGISEGRGGAYRHHVVLERLDSGEGVDEKSAMATWKSRGIEADVVSVGSIFAIAGQVFDTRQILLVTGSTQSRDDAEAMIAELESVHDIELSLHSEMTAYPSALLTLTADGLPITLRHQDVIWVDPGETTLSFNALPGEGKRAAGLNYRGAIVFAPDQDGKLAVINAAPVEEVLRGVVPAELYSTAPLESLKVQAVAARGTMLAQVGVRHLADPYHLCNTQHCQVFRGLDATTKRTDEAVAGTRGKVLFGGKRLAETFYSSNCGGTSEKPEDAWGIRPRLYLHAHDDDAGHAQHSAPRSEADLSARLKDSPKAWCNTDAYSSGRHFRWSKTLSASEVTKLVNKKHAVGKIRSLKIVERGAGGRISKLEVIGAKGSALIERELTIRRLFGGLKSAMFVLDVETDGRGRPKNFTFNGGGFGHGVGMCQTGAMGMANGGHDFDQILQHYYPGTTLKTLW